MLNPYVIKKYIAYLISATIPTATFFSVVKTRGLLAGLVGFMIAILFTGFISNILLNNPFRKMLEGKGLLVLNLDSTGVIGPFNVNLQGDKLISWNRGKLVKDVWNREIVSNITEMVDVKGEATKTGDGGIKFEITGKEFNKARFALGHRPVLIWNEQLNSFITKDMLSKNEKSAYAEHSILFLNKGVQELSSLTRDLARAVIDTLKPKWDMKKIMLWVLIAIIIVLAILFLPKIFPALKTAGSGLTQGVQQASKTAIVTPVAG